MDPVEHRLAEIQDRLASMDKERDDLVAVLEAMGSALNAMSESLDVLGALNEALQSLAEQVEQLTEALLPEDDDTSRMTLDGDLEGGERDDRQELDARTAEDNWSTTADDETL